ncbi:hypothetical protein HOP50_18g81620 [Chloropicon primus]|nr:hypothetical protein HOP50_18g81620 [Chloropicon primus]
MALGEFVLGEDDEEEEEEEEEEEGGVQHEEEEEEATTTARDPPPSQHEGKDTERRDDLSISSSKESHQVEGGSLVEGEDRRKEAKGRSGGQEGSRFSGLDRGCQLQRQRFDLEALVSRSDALKGHKKLVRGAAVGLHQWSKAMRRDTERWLGVDESLQSIHMMAKSALGDMQEARDALKRCSRLASGR